MAVARPAISPKALTKFIDSLSKGCTINEACKAAHVGRRTMYDYRRDDPAFAARWDEAREARVDLLEQEANARAMDRNDPKSADLLRFLLRGYRRETFGEKVEVNATVQAITAGELAAARAAAEADPETFARVAGALTAGKAA